MLKEVAKGRSDKFIFRYLKSSADSQNSISSKQLLLNVRQAVVSGWFLEVRLPNRGFKYEGGRTMSDSSSESINSLDLNWQICQGGKPIADMAKRKLKTWWDRKSSTQTGKLSTGVTNAQPHTEQPGHFVNISLHGDVAHFRWESRAGSCHQAFLFYTWEFSLIIQIPILQLKELQNVFIEMVHKTLFFLNPKWFNVFNTTLQREKKHMTGREWQKTGNQPDL